MCSGGTENITQKKGEISFVHQKSTTQYPFQILYLPTQIKMNIVYRKTGFKREF